MLRAMASRLCSMRYSSSSGVLSEQEITTRVMDVLKKFDKADKSKVPMKMSGNV